MRDGLERVALAVAYDRWAIDGNVLAPSRAVENMHSGHTRAAMRERILLRQTLEAGKMVCARDLEARDTEKKNRPLAA